MKKQRIFTALLAMIMLVALLAGCGSSSKAAMDMATGEFAPAEMPAMEYSMTEENGVYYAPSTPTDAEEAEPDVFMQGKANVKLIYNASLNLETTEFDKVVSALNSLVASMGGYYEENNVNNYGNYRNGCYTIRIPAENFSTFCSQAGELCHLTSISQSAYDISESYYDTSSRLATQQTKLERLQALLAKAENMEDIITLESAISETELQIEQLTGTLRNYDSLVGYSTISVYLDEVYKLSDVEEPAIGFGAKFSAAFKAGCTSFVNGLQGFLLWLARSWAGILLFLVIVAVVVVIIVFANRRSRRRQEEFNARQDAINAQRRAAAEQEKKQD